MTATSGQPNPLQLMIQRSFMSLYTTPYVSSDESDGGLTSDAAERQGHTQGYDYAFEFPSATIYMLFYEGTIQTNSLQIEHKEIDELRKQSVNQLFKRHTHLIKDNAQLKAPADPDKPVFFVGVTSLSIEQEQAAQKIKLSSQNQGKYTITHQYGSTFFAEECIVDLDNEDNVLQIFSIQNFFDILNKLQTPSDLVAFLKFHRTKFVEQFTFKAEMDLLGLFLNSPTNYQRAIAVQNKLADIGLLDDVEGRLLQTLLPDQSEHIAALNEQLLKNTQMWNKLMNGFTKHMHEVGVPYTDKMVKILTAESMYTRNCLMEDILDYTSVSAIERQQGYVRHQHSYNAFGRHYMLVFYARDPKSELSPDAVRKNYKSMLLEVNAQLQDPVMEDLLIIGVSFTAQGDTGNSEVKIEAFHQPGFSVSAASADPTAIS